MAAHSSTRRLKLETVETAIKSSTGDLSNENESPNPPQPLASKPLDTATKANRTFAPEPTDTLVKYPENQSLPHPEDLNHPCVFAQVLVEVSDQTSSQITPKAIATQPHKSRKKFAEEWESQVLPQKHTKKDKRPSRKFASQPIETAQRSRRVGALSPTFQPSDRAKASPLDNRSMILSASNPPSPRTNTPTFDYSRNPLFLEINRATSPLNRQRSLPRVSVHSFKVPELEPIESSESEGSSPPSPVTTPSVSSDRPRMRSTADEKFSGRLPNFTSQTAQKQSCETAIAALPNSDNHEPVNNFANQDEDGSSLFTNTNAAHDSSSRCNKIKCGLKAIQQQQQQLEIEQNVRRETKPRPDATNTMEDTKQDLWSSAVTIGSSAKGLIGSPQKDYELHRMRKGARPPMLGSDIKFPRCFSPELAQFDSTQGCDIIGKVMCYLTEQSQAAEKGESLWCGSGNGKQLSKAPSLWSNVSSRSQSRSGLWGGCCVDSGNTPSRGPTGILTPNHEEGSPLEAQCPIPPASLLPPTPPASHVSFTCTDEKHSVYLSTEVEFGNDFVTQVYNYLSLGYPSMARPFDRELSKISRISIAELRQDDRLARSRGYIRLGADGNLASAEITEESCMRWRALRTYIQKWVMQHNGLSSELLADGSETAVRSGSWAA